MATVFINGEPIDAGRFKEPFTFPHPCKLVIENISDMEPHEYFDLCTSLGATWDEERKKRQQKQH